MKKYHLILVSFVFLLAANEVDFTNACFLHFIFYQNPRVRIERKDIFYNKFFLLQFFVLMAMQNLPY